MKKFVAITALLALASGASAAIRINEVFINPPGTDNGLEFVELFGSANESLNNVWLLAVEGDGTAAGVVDLAIDYSGFSIGSNGLFLHRDAATVLNPAPDAGTNIRVSDFNPDIENGSNTYLLVTGFTGAVTNDLDTNNDGIFDITPWTSVLGAVALIENDGAANIAYAASVGGVNFGPNAGFNADGLVYGADGTWYGMDVTGAATGPFDFDTTRMADQFGNAVAVAGTLTPGSANLIPTPGALALAGMGCVLAARRRRA